jgi:rhodanese-related sulfurtransferase
MPAKNIYQDIDLRLMNQLLLEPDTLLVDVREPWEFEEFNVGGINIPLADIRAQRSVLQDAKTIIVICTNGVRSKVAAMDYCRIPEWIDKRILHVSGGILEA